MRKILLFMAIVFAINYANAQKIDAAKVPSAVKTAVAKKYPSTTIAKWEMEDGNYEANFKQDGKSMSAIFIPDGTFKESEAEIKVSELPAGVLDYVKARYNNKKVSEAAKVTKANGIVNYEAEVNGKDLIFDANGKYLKEEEE